MKLQRDVKKTKKIDSSIEAVIEDVMTDLGRQYKEATLAFARGTKIRREGKAPYLHILKWLAESDEGSIDLKEEMNRHPELKGSVGQVVNKEFLGGLLEDQDKRNLFEQIVFYDPETFVFGAEDPKFLFYLKNLVWRSFTRDCGFAGDFFGGRFDFALSFAGADRPLVKKIADKLAEREIGVFYDFDQQHEILGLNVETYLAPIYRSEARYIIPFLSSSYPKRIWTKFESEQFKERFGSNSVFPVRFADTQGGYFFEEDKFGGLFFDPSKDEDPQVEEIVEVLARRLIEDREKISSEVKG